MSAAVFLLAFASGLGFGVPSGFGFWVSCGFTAFLGAVASASAMTATATTPFATGARTFAATCVGGGFAELCGDGLLRDVLLKEAFDGGEEGLVLLADEGDGATVLTSTGGASDAVDVVFFVVGHVVVDDELYVVDVNAASYDVCGHENIDLTGLEAVHDVVALFLQQVAVHGFGIVAFALEGDGDILSVDFLADEDNDALGLALLEEVFYDAELLGLVADEGALMDALGGFVECYLDFDGVGEDGLGELDNLVGHGGGEHNGLPLLRQE